MSELLNRLRRELNTLTDPVARAEIVARIAGVLARSGKFDDARNSIDVIKEQFGRGESGRVTVWKMIAEGLVFHYENLSPAALERMSGAQVLGRAMNYPASVALASAWKAHIEFERSDFVKMTESLAAALHNVESEDHDTQTRISMVLANAFMICGDRSQMQTWFLRGRDHAVKNGDRASVAALQYNKAAFSTAWARVSSCIAPLKADELLHLRGEVNSACNLQELSGIAALNGHIQLVHARLLMLEQRYELAFAALNIVRHTVPFAQHNFRQLYIDLEVQFCAVMLGGTDFSMAARYPDLLQEFADLDIDERIVASWMLARIAQAAGLDEALAALDDELERLLTTHATNRGQLRESLASIMGSCSTIGR